jgi:hypothetical protein
MMRTGDRARSWNNMQTGPIVRHATTLKLTELGETGFRARLSWMLRTASSPYQQHLDPAHANSVIDGFMRWLHHDGTAAVDGEGWAYQSVHPDFLYATGYYSNEPPRSVGPMLDPADKRHQRLIALSTVDDTSGRVGRGVDRRTPGHLPGCGVRGARHGRRWLA